jgi:hypothetical protein
MNFSRTSSRIERTVYEPPVTKVVECKQYVYCIIISAYVHFVSNSRVFTQYPNKEHLGLEAPA